jgi:hypothetical protein
LLTDVAPGYRVILRSEATKNLLLLIVAAKKQQQVLRVAQDGGKYKSRR